MLKRQQGMTMIGVLFVLALVGVIGYAGMRILPLYLNYMKVARSMEATAAEFKGDNRRSGRAAPLAREALANRGYRQRGCQGRGGHQGG